jgi:pilus assembly protein CpaB
LPVGTILDPTAFRFQPWPKELMENSYYLQQSTNIQTLAGQVVRNAISAGQPLTIGSLIKPGERGFLAAALGPGMRAVTVPVSVNTSVAGFVFPGDRIDLMLTQSVPGGGDGLPLKVSETFLRNLRVLATDQRMDALGADGKPVVQPYANVTLEVTPKIAEKLSVAQTIGSLSLSLRSIADNQGELESAIASGAVKVPDGNDPAAEKSMMLTIANRPTEGRSSFATGADVSRFQRSSVPAKPKVTVGPPLPDGPSVRIARGATVTIESVGVKQ